LLSEPFELSAQVTVGSKVASATGDGYLGRNKSADEEGEQHPHDSMRT
jgi:hypothetical protein